MQHSPNDSFTLASSSQRARLALILTDGNQLRFLSFPVGAGGRRSSLSSRWPADLHEQAIAQHGQQDRGQAQPTGRDEHRRGYGSNCRGRSRPKPVDTAARAAAVGPRGPSQVSHHYSRRRTTTKTSLGGGLWSTASDGPPNLEQPIGSSLPGLDLSALLWA